MRRAAAASTLASAACAFLVALSVSAVVRAQASQRADQAAAHAALKEGDRLRDAGDLRGALERYTAAQAVLHDPPTGLSVVSAQAALGMLVEARQTAVDTAELPVVKGEPAGFAEARSAAAQTAAEIEPRLPVFGVVVTPEVPYTLRIDGMPVPEEAKLLRFRTNPGDHVVEIDAKGYLHATQTFTLAEGVHQLFQIALVATPAAPPPAPPPPIAAVSTPAPAVDSGSHAQRTRGYVGLVLGGSALVAGTITGVMSFSETSNAKRNCPGNVCPDRLRDTLETADTLANVANVLLPLGLLGVAYGMVELLTLPDEPEAALSFSIGVGGATLRGKL